MREVKKYIQRKAHQKTFPIIFVDGEFLGGLGLLQHLIEINDEKFLSHSPLHNKNEINIKEEIKEEIKIENIIENNNEAV